MNIPTGIELLKVWEDAKRKGITMKELAGTYGITRKALDGRIYKARDKYGGLPDKRETKTSNSISDIETGNYRLVQVQGCEIKTPEQLIEKAQIDLDVWYIPHASVKSWPLGRRAEAKQVTYKNGRIVDGIIEDSGKLYMDMQYYVSIELVRRKPEPIKPVLQPVTFRIKSKQRKCKPSALSQYKKALLIPDSQMGFRRDFDTGKLIPFHDRRAHDIILQLASLYTWDAIVLLGDGLDFTEWSDKFVKEPEFYQTTKPAIIEFAWFLAQLRRHAGDNTPIKLIQGNHEKRRDTYLMTHMLAGYGLKPSTELELDEPYSLSRLLGLEQLGVEMSDNYPNGDFWLDTYFRCLHNLKLSNIPGMTVANMLKASSYTTAAAHNHRLEMATKNVSDHDGQRLVTCATCGCLCHLDYRVPGHKATQNWQQGFGVAYYGPKSPEIKLHQIDYESGSVIYNDQLIVGVDYLAQLAQDTNYRF